MSETVAWFTAIENHFSLHHKEAEAILAGQREIISLLKELQMSQTNSLAALQAAVAAETAVDQSVLTLLTTLAAQLSAASPTGDNPAVDAVVATMTANAASLSAAVVANTPAPVLPAG